MSKNEELEKIDAAWEKIKNELPALPSGMRWEHGLELENRPDGSRIVRFSPVVAMTIIPAPDK